MRIPKQIKQNGVFFLLLLLASGIWVYNLGGMLGAWSPIGDGDDDVYLISNDIIKNFQFETFDGDGISLGGQSIDAKLQFEDQASWRINKDDIQLISIYTQGDDVYIRYKVAMTDKINIFTTVDLNEGAENNQLTQITDSYLTALYYHRGLFGHVLYGWDAYLDWNHYDFGNVKQWNEQHNAFEGDLVMSFDIAQSPLPNFQTQSGDAITKNFDYIAVSSIAVKNNIHGLLDQSAPDIVGLQPSEFGSTRNTATSEDAGNVAKYVGIWDPQIDLDIYSDPLNTFDAGIIPQSAGSNMHPRTKSGDPIWNPEEEQTSMRDCKFIYHVGSLSPLVKEYYGTISYTYKHVETIDVWGGINEFSRSEQTFTYTEPVALHITNRYIQVEVRVVFDVFASYNIDVGGDGIEDYDLDFPAEYYDLLTWLTTVEGFGGGEQHTTGLMADLFGFGSIIAIILIVVAIAIVSLAVYFLYLKPMLEAKRTRKLVETAIRSAKQSTRPK